MSATYRGLIEVRPRDGPSHEHSEQPCGFKGEEKSPKSLTLQVGSKRANPDELTQVSDSGARTQLTTLQLQGQRGAVTLFAFIRILTRVYPLTQRILYIT
ncbi:hypothetical protein A6J64_016275 [Yersinia enterocolitica]|nr:hypothetical protein A6J64_016275 [Yersinia enterocolitica]